MIGPSLHRAYRAFALLLFLTMAAVPAAAEDELLWPDDASALASAEISMRALANKHAARDSQEAAAILALLDMTTQPITDRLALAGLCKVRSLQANDLGAYVYPFFKCEFRREGPGGLQFRKETGSQRRLGLILEEGDLGDGLLFVGGRYYDYTSPRPYSGFDRLDNPGSSPDRSTDSVGAFYKIGKNRYMMLFAPRDGRGEIYEITR